MLMPWEWIIFWNLPGQRRFIRCTAGRSIRLLNGGKKNIRTVLTGNRWSISTKGERGFCSSFLVIAAEASPIRLVILRLRTFPLNNPGKQHDFFRVFSSFQVIEKDSCRFKTHFYHLII